MKKIFIDTETTGFDREACALLQVAGHIDIDRQVVETFDFKIKPWEGCQWLQSAIDKTKITPEIASEYNDSGETFLRFIKLLERYVDRYDREDKMFFVGYNGNFDCDFIRAWFLREAKTEEERKYGNGFGSFFWVPTIDVMLLAAMRTMTKRALFENFQLGTVCRTLGLEFDAEKAHGALYDATKTRELYYFLGGK